MSTKKDAILNLIKEFFPNSYDEISKNDLIRENLFSPFEIDLPQNILEQVKEFTKTIYQIKELESYQEQIVPKKNINHWPLTPSLFTCLDFHYTEETGLKLIEINTNASLYLPLCLARMGRKAFQSETMSLLASAFKEVFGAKKEISIFDFDPKKEGLYFEFLVLKEWLEQMGFKSNVISLEQYKDTALSGIYNRYTDFYFTNESSEMLLQDYESKHRLFSPNPREYYLLADKRRLELLRKHLSEASPSLAPLIPQTLLFKDFDSKDDLWKNRKKYFFKPSQSFGSKGVYRGRSISRKAFDNIYTPHFIAQEYCPPGKITLEHQGENHTMKYDLRFYIFKGQVQNYGARLYQGQATNMRTPHGGITPIKFI